MVEPDLNEIDIHCIKHFGYNTVGDVNKLRAKQDKDHLIIEEFEYRNAKLEEQIKEQKRKIGELTIKVNTLDRAYAGAIKQSKRWMDITNKKCIRRDKIEKQIELIESNPQYNWVGTEWTDEMVVILLRSLLEDEYGN